MKKAIIFLIIIITAILFILSGIRQNNKKNELNKINAEIVQACTIDMAKDSNIICD